MIFGSVNGETGRIFPNAESVQARSNLAALLIVGLRFASLLMYLQLGCR